VTEYVKGNKNQFRIQPKQLSGSVVNDALTAGTDGFYGQDLFHTETFFANGSWYRDQGIADYQSIVYEIQQIVVPPSLYSQSIVLFFPDYLTPSSNIIFSSRSFTANDSVATLQSAIQSLSNVDSVDVSREANSSAEYSVFLITFLSNLGNVPLLNATSGVSVQEVVAGVTETQFIEIAADIDFVRERPAISDIFSFYSYHHHLQ
jgi:hypothetical protein